MLPDPFTVIVAFVPLSCPVALPDTVRPFPHDAVKVPSIDVDVCEEISYWRLPHVLAEGSDAELHTPTIDGDVLPGVVGDEGVGLDAGVDVVAPDVDVGERTLDACSKPHAPTAVVATSTARTERHRFMGMLQTCPGTHGLDVPPPDDYRVTERFET
jgi:hypothetical protein